MIDVFQNQIRAAAPRWQLARICGRAAWLLAVGLSTATCASSTNTFTNPVAARGADPWVIRQGGNYYYCQSRGGSITVSGAERLVDLGKNRGTRVWTLPSGTAYSRELSGAGIALRARSVVHLRGGG
ncbi:MAG: hypothetical protein QM813_19085 [Verrucomicrobiota bacterium]